MPCDFFLEYGHLFKDYLFESVLMLKGAEGEYLEAESLLSAEPDSELDPMVHEIMTSAKTKS